MMAVIRDADAEENRDRGLFARQIGTREAATVKHDLPRKKA